MLSVGALTRLLAHAGGADAGWLAWLPHVVAFGLAIGVSVAARRLYRTPTFGGGRARRFLTLGGLIALATVIGLGVFEAVARVIPH